MRSGNFFGHTVVVIYRGHSVTDEQIVFIRRLIQDRPGWSRWKLSRELCQAWQWKQANGALRDMVCRGLLLMLHRSGEIELPPIKRAVRNRIAERARPSPVFVEQHPVQSSLGDLRPLEFVQVRRTPEEALFNSLLDQHHYLGYERPVGEHLKYLVRARGQVIACSSVVECAAVLEGARPLSGLEQRSARAQCALARLQHALSDFAVGPSAAFGVAHFGAHGKDHSSRLAAPIRPSDLLAGNVRGYVALHGGVLPRGQLA